MAFVVVPPKPSVPKHCVRTWGLNFDLVVLTGATAAIGICSRRGLGKVRHLATADLRVQDRLRAGDFSLEKVAGSDNPADILTKFLERPHKKKHLANLRLRAEQGRAAAAPTIEHTVACLR